MPGITHELFPTIDIWLSAALLTSFHYEELNHEIISQKLLIWCIYYICDTESWNLINVLCKPYSFIYDKPSSGLLLN